MKKPNANHRAAVSEAARRIYKALGSGFVEQVYRDALAVELRALGLYYEVERNIEVFYRGERVGLHRLDFIVERCLVVELKAAAKISEHNFAQTRAYLQTTDLGAALVINFPTPENEDGPEIQLVTPRARVAAGRVNRGTGRRRVNTVRKRVERPGNSRHTLPHSQKKERKPLGDLVWDAAARRYADKRSPSIASVPSSAIRHASTQDPASSESQANTSRRFRV